MCFFRLILLFFFFQMTTISETEMDKIGEIAEIEYENEIQQEEKTEKPKQKRVRLSTGQRMKLVEDFRNGKLDRNYRVSVDKKRPGEFRITKRKKPIDVPEYEPTSCPNTIGISLSRVPSHTAVDNEPKKENAPVKPEKQDKVNIEFYAMQNNINNSLSREIQAVMEKCNKIERKMKEQRQLTKNKKQTKEDEYEYEYSDSDEKPNTNEPNKEQINLTNPQQYRGFNARSRINLLHDFR